MSDTNLTRVERCRQWRTENASLLKSRIRCECGLTYTYTNKYQHVRTKNHQNMLQIEALRKQLKEALDSD
jgi:hypothetical protein